MSIAEWARDVSAHQLAEHPELLDTEPMRAVPEYRQQVERIVLAGSSALVAASDPPKVSSNPGCAIYLAVLGGGLLFAVYSIHDPWGPGLAWLLTLGGVLLAVSAASVALPLRRSDPPWPWTLGSLTLLDLVAAVGLWRATQHGVEPASPWWLGAAAGVVVSIGFTVAMFVVRLRSTPAQRARVVDLAEQWTQDLATKQAEVPARTRAQVEEAWSSLPLDARERLSVQRRTAFDVLHGRGLLDDVDAEMARTPGMRIYEKQAIRWEEQRGS